MKLVSNLSQLRGGAFLPRTETLYFEEKFFTVLLVTQLYFLILLADWCKFIIVSRKVSIPILKSNYLSVQLLEVKSLKCSLFIYSYFDRRRIAINSNNNSNNNGLSTAFPLKMALHLLIKYKIYSIFSARKKYAHK